ncbi:Transcription factor DIVARICATA [Linum perenne]
MNRGMEILSPASYLQNSGWLFQESKWPKWTSEENKRFENALALYDRDTPDRWSKVAALIPGKTVGDVIKQYRELEEDVSDIEAGLIPVPGYDASDSFTLELVNSHSYDELKDFYSPGGKRGISTRPSEQERKKGVPWTEEEHRQFLLGLEKYGKGDWRNISRNFVMTRTPTQVASHAQKYFIRQSTGGKDKKRSSIHDITTVNPPSDSTNKSSSSPDCCSTKLLPCSPDHSSTADKSQLKIGEGFTVERNAQGSNVANLCGMSSAYGANRLQQEQKSMMMMGGGSPLHQLGSYGLVYQMQSMQNQ